MPATTTKQMSFDQCCAQIKTVLNGRRAQVKHILHNLLEFESDYPIIQILDVLYGDQLDVNVNVILTLTREDIVS